MRYPLLHFDPQASAVEEICDHGERHDHRKARCDRTKKEQHDQPRSALPGQLDQGEERETDGRGLSDEPHVAEHRAPQQIGPAEQKSDQPRAPKRRHSAQAAPQAIPHNKTASSVWFAAFPTIKTTGIKKSAGSGSLTI